MDLNVIHQGIAAVASTITGMRGASPWELDTIPATPYAVVGMARATITDEGSQSSRHYTTIEIPIRLYVEAISGHARDAVTTNSFVNAYVNAYALDQDLGGSVRDAYITTWDADRFYGIGGALYAAVDFTLTARVAEVVPQALRTKL